jgi:signal transduction histidine kinase
MLPTLIKFGKIRLREENQFRLMDNVVRSTLHSFNVEMVTIYNDENIISYSYNRSLIGQNNAGGVHYEKAMKKEATSRLMQNGRFLELIFWYPQETKIITFSPLRPDTQLVRGAESPVLGVVEIIRDISDDYKRVFKLQGLIVGTIFLVMGVLFLILRFVVKHGENIIEKRAEERLRLEEKLRRAEHLSAIGEMTAGVSHEIRNPLGIINSSAQLLKNKMQKLDAGTGIPDIIIEESARLDKIITDFLDFARPKTPDLHPCRVEKIIEKNIAYLEPQIKENHITIEKEIAGNIPEVMADSAMLYQAFLNILINAFQAIDENGKIIIRVKYRAGDVIINFTDNGGGIPKDILKKIWTPFFTTKDTGTGLGLGIVKNMIESQNGTISVKNIEQTGADIEIVLPV